jgi:DNA repair exonuclease SbcCD ATPase subunit
MSKKLWENENYRKNRLNDEAKEKIRQSRLNSNLSEETKNKITEKSKQNWQDEKFKDKNWRVNKDGYVCYRIGKNDTVFLHRLIANTIPQIEDEINNILSQLVDFAVVLHADDKNINAYIAYDEDNFWPLELTSGMEKFVASLAIRTSLINVSTLPRPNFVAIDEGFGALDQTNLSSMVMLFDYLKTQFKFIMIISHIDSMRDVVDHHIEINKVNGRSKIEQTA